MKTSERGEVATILAISAIVVIGISMISSAFLGGKKQSTSSKANDVCNFYKDFTCDDIGCGGTCTESGAGARCCTQVADTVAQTVGDPQGYGLPAPDKTVTDVPATQATTVPTAVPATGDTICPGGNQACSSNCGSGNDCVKYLESVTVPGLSDGSVIDTDSFSCDIVTKNVAGVRTDMDNICGVKVNDQWPAWCPWDGVGQYMCGATITSRANCNLKSSHFNNTPVKAGDKLQVVAARKTGSCGNIPWNTAGNFITGPTFYYKQKGGGSTTNTTPQATTVPKPQGNTNAQPTTSTRTSTIAPTNAIADCKEYGRTNICNAECTNAHPGWSCRGSQCCAPGAKPTTVGVTSAQSPIPTQSSSLTPTTQTPAPSSIPCVNCHNTTPTPLPTPCTNCHNALTSTPTTITPTYSSAGIDFSRTGSVKITINLLNMVGRTIEEELPYFSCTIKGTTGLINIFSNLNPECKFTISSRSTLTTEITNILRFSNDSTYTPYNYDISARYNGRPGVKQKDIINSQGTHFLGDEFNKSFSSNFDFSEIKKNFSISAKNTHCSVKLVIPKNSVKVLNFTYPDRKIEIEPNKSEIIAEAGVDTDDQLQVQLTKGVCVNIDRGTEVDQTLPQPSGAGNNYAFLIEI